MGNIVEHSKPRLKTRTIFNDGEILKKTSHQQRRFVVQALFGKQIEGNFSICIFWDKPWKKNNLKVSTERKSSCWKWYGLLYW